MYIIMKKFFENIAALLFISSSLTMVSCGPNSHTPTEGEDIHQVTEAEFYNAISFKYDYFYKYHQSCSGIEMDNTVNNMLEVVYTEKSVYWNSFYVREKDGYVYLYDWNSEENIYFKYRDGLINDMDGYAINTIPFYTKELKYNNFTYQVEKKAYYQERSEEDGGLPGQYQTRRVYLYFEYQRLIKLEYFVYQDKTDWEDRIITVQYNDVWQANLGHVDYVDKGDIGDNM